MFDHTMEVVFDETYNEISTLTDDHVQEADLYEDEEFTNVLPQSLWHEGAVVKAVGEFDDQKPGTLKPCANQPECKPDVQWAAV